MDLEIPEKVEVKLDKKTSSKKKTRKKKTKDLEIKSEVLDGLEDIIVSDEDLNKFWNSMLRKKAHRQVFIVKDLEFTFKTRTSGEVKNLISFMDKVTFQYTNTESYLNMEANIALALVEYDSVDLTTNSLEENIEFIRELPSPITKILSDKLGEFDSKIFKMTELVTNENF